MADPPVSNDDFALATVATRPDEAGGPPPQVLRATGQPQDDEEELAGLVTANWDEIKTKIDRQ
jgi:hypothetical protein